MKKIITHSGQAHFDDFVACCLLLAHGVRNKEKPSIERCKSVSAEDLAAPTICVVDVGMLHQPELSNFDHHQFELGVAPRCAISLVLSHLGLYDTAKAFWPWLTTAEINDVMGPQAIKEYVGAVKDVSCLRSPLERFFLNEFGKYSVDNPNFFYTNIDFGSQMWNVMNEFGLSLLEELSMVKARKVKWDKLVIEEIGTVGVIDLTDSFGGNDTPLFGADYCLNGRGVKVMVSNDDRGAGFAITRRQSGAKYIDLSKLIGDPLVAFAHKGGFTAKVHHTATKEQIRDLIKKALVTV